MVLEPQLVEMFRCGSALLQHMTNEGILGFSILGTVFGKTTVYPLNLAEIMEESGQPETSEGSIQSLEAGFREAASIIGANIQE